MWQLDIRKKLRQKFTMYHQVGFKFVIRMEIEVGLWRLIRFGNRVAAPHLRLCLVLSLLMAIWRVSSLYNSWKWTLITGTWSLELRSFEGLLMPTALYFRKRIKWSVWWSSVSGGSDRCLSNCCPCYSWVVECFCCVSLFSFLTIVLYR